MCPLGVLRRLSTILAVCGLLIYALAHEAYAQTELSRTPISIFALNNCPLSGSCFIDFGAVPAKRRYEIINVSCYLVIGNVNGKPLYWYLYANKGSERVGEIQLRPASLGVTSTDHTYNANEQGFLVVPAGGIIGVTVTRDSSTAGAIPGLQCTIGGYKVRLQ